MDLSLGQPMTLVYHYGLCLWIGDPCAVKDIGLAVAAQPQLMTKDGVAYAVDWGPEVSSFLTGLAEQGLWVRPSDLRYVLSLY